MPSKNRLGDQPPRGSSMKFIQSRPNLPDGSSPRLVQPGSSLPRGSSGRLVQPGFSLPRGSSGRLVQARPSLPRGSSGRLDRSISPASLPTVGGTAPTIDSILEESFGNHLGRYQLWIILMACLPAFMVGALTMSYIIQLSNPIHRCYIIECDRDLQSSIYNNSKAIDVLPSTPSGMLDSCHMFVPSLNRTGDPDHQCTREQFMDSIMPCPNRQYVYDQTYFQQTIVTELGLFCKNSQLLTLRMAFFFGIMIGCPVNGMIADRFGRSIIFRIYPPILFILLLFLTEISGNIWVYGFSIFLKGWISSAIFPISFTAALEDLPNDSIRFWTGNILQVMFAFGEMFITAVGWGYKSWRIVERWNLLPATLMLPFPFIYFESIRWQLSNGETIEAHRNIISACHINRKPVPKNLATKIQVLTPDPEVENDSKADFLDLFTHPSLGCITLGQCFIWCTVAMIYYGLGFLAGDVNENIYISWMALMAAEIPGVFGTAIVGAYSRKQTIGWVTILCGLACITVAFLPSNGLPKMALAIAGKMFISGAFSLIYIYALEIYPTQIRTTAIGTFSSMARIGSMLAPTFLQLIIFGKTIPFVLLGILPLISGIITLWWMPETQGRRLPETLDDLNVEI